MLKYVKINIRMYKIINLALNKKIVMTKQEKFNKIKECIEKRIFDANEISKETNIPSFQVRNLLIEFR